MAWTFSGILKGFLIQNEVDRSKELVITVDASATTNTRTTLVAAQTADRTITLPDGDATLVTTSSTQTLTNKTMDGDLNTFLDIGITSLKTDLAAASTFISRDASGVVISTKAVPAGVVIGTTDAQVLTNKTIDADANTITNIENADIKAGAAIAVNKLAATTASRALVSDGSGFISPATTTATEIGYVNLVTSSIQAQLDAKTPAALASAHILVGNVSNIATDVAMSGDIAISNTGATAYTGVVPLIKGGTGTVAASANAAFNALSPMTTTGDLIYGGSSGVGTRLGIGSTSQVLTVSGGLPTWQAAAAASSVLVIQTKSSNYTALISDDLILCSSSFTLSLYTAVGNTGRVLRIKKTDSSPITNIITVDPSGSETIDGNSTITLNTQNEEWTLVSDGSNWQVLDHKTITPWISVGGTGITIDATTTAPTKGTRAVDDCFWRRNGQNVEAMYTYRQTNASGAATGSGAYLIAFPFDADTSVLYPNTGISTSQQQGLGTRLGSATLILNGSFSGEAQPEIYNASFFKIRYIPDGSIGSNFWSSSAVALTNAQIGFSAIISVPVSGWYP